MRNDALGFFWEDLPAQKKKTIERPKREAPSPTWLAPDYLPNLDRALAEEPVLITDEELHASKGDYLVFDVESYENYFLAAFRSLSTGKIIYFELQNGLPMDMGKLLWVMQNFTIIGFNSYNYDLPILSLAVAGKTAQDLKQATSMIISDGMRSQEVLKQFRVKLVKCENHIDLIEVAPLFGSLKTYGGRLHTPTMQDLPFHPNTVLSDNQIKITRWYCFNDLIQTALLYQSLKEQIHLRESLGQEYGLDLRSRSDAQIAEYVISNSVTRLTGSRARPPVILPGTFYYYRAPVFLKYKSELMNWALDVIKSTRFIVSEQGNVGMPEELKNLDLKIGDATYRMGIGGLHSSEKMEGHVADNNYVIVDRDVTSYYPYIIMNLGLYPQHLGRGFLAVYRQIVERRIAAKHAGNKVVSDSLKITINGSFGKFGSKYSSLYSPDLLIQTTVTGQLSLLMLIEALEIVGIRVVSANTDGIVIKCPRARHAEMEGIVADWEKATGFQTEETSYRAIYSRDVNNYIAIRADGTIKAKGAYARPGLQKNPTNEICIEALEQLLINNIPIHETIHACKDIRKFINVRTVKGGAVRVWGRRVPAHVDKKDLLQQTGFEPLEGGYWRHPSWKNALDVASLESAYEHAVLMWPEGEHEYLGKSIRWYYATGRQGEIVYASNGNKVPRSDGACPLMVLPETLPKDIDYDWYIEETNKILKQIGYCE